MLTKKVFYENSKEVRPLLDKEKKVSRRNVLKIGATGALALIGSTLLNPGSVFQKSAQAMNKHEVHAAMKDQLHAGMQHGYDPGKEVTEGLKAAQKALTTFDYGKASTTLDGKTLREYEMIAYETEVEIAKGVKFPGWTFNGTIPGPTLRCTEGDIVRVKFTNASSHPHSMHFHGIHPTNMDGLESLMPGDSFIYEFEAKPAGMQLYHCLYFFSIFLNYHQNQHIDLLA